MLKHIESVIEFIEENLKNQLTADIISENAYLSKFHLQRIFKTIIGKGLIEYVRSRKMTSCLDELKNSNLSIMRIGCEYGYIYEQSFTRAFKSEFKISPLEYRRNPITLNITPKIDISLIVELENAVIIKPYHVSKPAFMLGGMLNKVKFDEKFEGKPNSLAVDFYFNHMTKIKNPVNQDVYYGYTMKDSEANDSTYYLTSIEIDDETTLTDGFTSIDVPETEYIVFKFIGFFPPSEITWKHMMDIWEFRDKYLLNSKGIDYKVYNYFEYIDSSLCTDDYCELDLYVPMYPNDTNQ